MPPFNSLGYLPPGIYEISWEELMERFATNPQRQRIVTGLAAALRKLAIAGCTRVIIGGSFISAKEEPNDFDAYYDNFGLDFDLLDPLFVENIDSQQEVFCGELFPTIGYDQFLQTDKSGNPRGVVALDPRKLNS
ncbi:DUF6932 family protein [Merismopedia glauca]|uniref:Uncharacterized protein n=1 Tax=Merismopedia glauca CCAP 1448/3 TaxID=1296344 RepID=A0A2T1C242_9CYAN|nr:hypothetical protein [Merismopedia glauca]PSB02331.1 hypothetical protein C7B64_13640 [Merismopedia glauca CCAP 1448/3]